MEMTVAYYGVEQYIQVETLLRSTAPRPRYMICGQEFDPCYNLVGDLMRSNLGDGNGRQQQILPPYCM
eukprot:scaffold27078_cov77-Skeletonema_dohrnii-CCMP3373.AAC.8